MPILFSEITTEHINFSLLLKDALPLEYLQTASTARQRVCDTLATQPASPVLLEAIEAYLPHLLRIMQYVETHPSADAALKFKWRSVLSVGIRMSIKSSIVEKPMVKCPSIWSEAIFTLISYAFALCNMASRKVMLAVSETACNEAIDLFCRASGLFTLICTSISPRWANPPKDRPPECTPELLLILSELALAEAQQLALAKAEKKSMSAATLIKLASAVTTKYEQCKYLLARINQRELDELSMPFRLYISESVALSEAIMLRLYALSQHEAGQNGVAVACLTHAYNRLLECRRSEHPTIMKRALELLSEVESLQANYTRINNMITYQSIPPIEEAKASIPSGRLIVEAKPFNLPPPAELPPTSNQMEEGESTMILP